MNNVKKFLNFYVCLSSDIVVVNQQPFYDYLWIKETSKYVDVVRNKSYHCGKGRKVQFEVDNSEENNCEITLDNDTL